MAAAVSGLLQGLNLLLQLRPAQLGLLAPSDRFLILACIPPPTHHLDKIVWSPRKFKENLT